MLVVHCEACGEVEKERIKTIRAKGGKKSKMRAKRTVRARPEDNLEKIKSRGLEEQRGLPVRFDSSTTLGPRTTQSSTGRRTRQQIHTANNVITRTAKVAVEGGREEVAQHFTLRQNFARSRVRVLTYSRVPNLTAMIGTDAYEEFHKEITKRIGK